MGNSVWGANFGQKHLNSDMCPAESGKAIKIRIISGELERKNRPDQGGVKEPVGLSYFAMLSCCDDNTGLVVTTVLTNG